MQGSKILTQWRDQRLAQRASARGGQWSLGGGVRRLIAPPTGGLRSYMAAANDRLVADLVESLGLTSINRDISSSLLAMRKRSRKLANDNEYVKHFLQLVRNNVVGPTGFKLQMKIYKQRTKRLDDDANTAIEEGYAEFSKRGVFTACGKMNRTTFDRAAVHQLARDGEVLIEVLRGGFNRFGLSFRLIDPDLLDESLNVGMNGSMPGYGRLQDGGDIRMGVERNKFGRATAFWFHNVHPGDDVVNVPIMRWRRIEADRIIHHFVVEELRPDAARGIPWLYAAVRRMAMASGYEEAALVSSRAGANQMGFYTQPAPLTEGPVKTLGVDASVVADGEDAQGNLIQEAEPGVFGTLPPGWGFEKYDPAYPHDQFEPFMKSMLRGFAAGTGINYATIASNTEGVNLSNMRHIAQEDRDIYTTIQQGYVENVAIPMFELWLGDALALGQLGGLPFDGLARFNKPKFVPRAWRMVDPVKEMQAREAALRMKITSRTAICAEDGVDFEDLLDEIAQEEDLARVKKVDLTMAPAAAAPAKPQATEPNKDDPKEDDDETTDGKA